MRRRSQASDGTSPEKRRGKVLSYPKHLAEGTSVRAVNTVPTSGPSALEGEHIERHERLREERRQDLGAVRPDHHQVLDPHAELAGQYTPGSTVTTPRSSRRSDFLAGTRVEPAGPRAPRAPHRARADRGRIARRQPGLLDPLPGHGVYVASRRLDLDRSQRLLLRAEYQLVDRTGSATGDLSARGRCA